MFIKHLHSPGTVLVDRDNTVTKTKNLPSRSSQSTWRDEQQINECVNKIISDTSKMEIQQVCGMEDQLMGQILFFCTA